MHANSYAGPRLSTPRTGIFGSKEHSLPSPPLPVASPVAQAKTNFRFGGRNRIFSSQYCSIFLLAIFSNSTFNISIPIGVNESQYTNLVTLKY